jgi:hypothetical protein
MRSDELRLAVRAKVNDLAVQHGVVGIQARTKGLASSARTACTVGTELHGMGNRLALNGCKRGDQMYTTSNLGSKMEILAYAAAKPVIQGFQVKP